jgi:hypothetical protein
MMACIEGGAAPSDSAGKHKGSASKMQLPKAGYNSCYFI